MGMTRRQFAKSLGAGIVLLPFLSAPGRAAAAPVRRIITISSLGIAETMWTPKSAPQAPVMLPDVFAALQPIMADLLLLNGLGYVVAPREGHSSPQLFTGVSNDTKGRPTTYSIDQFIAKALGTTTKMSSLVLGVAGKNEGIHFAAGQPITPEDNPMNAFQAAFGVGAAATASPSAMPRKPILDLVVSQIKTVQQGLGSAGRQRLDQHLASIEALEANLGGVASAACGKLTPPNLGGADPENNAAAGLVADAHSDIVVNALACDVTRVVAVQFGISNNQFVQFSPTQGTEEHSQVHSGAQGIPSIVSCETFLCTWFANLVSKLKATPDPANPGTTLLDNTLLLWGRDIGDGPNHIQYGNPFVVAGATGYLKHSATGIYQTYGGNNSQGVVGTSHQQLLLNLAEFMGVAATGFGNFDHGGTAAPLTDIKA